MIGWILWGLALLAVLAAAWVWLRGGSAAQVMALAGIACALQLLAGQATP